MSLTLYYLSGSPYAWRVWLALEHKGLDYQIRPMSLDAGDFNSPSFIALNPRRRVLVLDDDGFALYESAAIVEYIEDKWPERPRLFSQDVRQRALQRRLIREADQYVATGMEHLVEAILFTPPEQRSQPRIDDACNAIRSELARWETIVAGPYLLNELSAADFTLFTELALTNRIGERHPALVKLPLWGPRLDAWYTRMRALPTVQKTWPPHWKS